MSVSYYGDFSEDETVYIPFNTFDSNDPTASVTITDLVDADLKVHKDGNTTEIVTDGATIAINFDSITGNHLITIDTSVSADYATGSDYIVRMEGTTVDAGTINAWVGIFSIENRHTAAGSTPPTAAAIADAVWEEAIVDHSTGTTFGGKNQLVVPSETLADYKATGFATPTNITAGTIATVSGNVNGSVGSVTAAVTTDAASRTASQATGFATETKQDLMQTDMDTLVDDQTLPKAEYVVVGDTIAGVTLVGTVTNLTNAATNGDLTAVMKASVNTEVDNGLNTAIPGSPTATSINDYMKRAKFAVCNRWDIDEPTGDLDVYDDSNSLFLATAAAFTTLAGVTLRKKIL